MSKYYFLGKQRLAMRQNGKLTYLHGDHLGSASLATDATGATLSQQRYLPYGGLRWAQSGSVFPTDWQYTDQQRQSTHLTGIRMVEYYDYRARMYDPKIGRFISPDSVVPDEKNPQAFNRFTYVYNSPLRFTDQCGNIPEDNGTPPPIGGTPDPIPAPTPPATGTPEPPKAPDPVCTETCNDVISIIQIMECGYITASRQCNTVSVNVPHPTLSGVLTTVARLVCTAAVAYSCWRINKEITERVCTKVCTP